MAISSSAKLTIALLFLLSVIISNTSGFSSEEKGTDNEIDGTEDSTIDKVRIALIVMKI